MTFGASSEIGQKKIVSVVQPKEWFQICAVLSAALSSISCGLLFSWTSPSLPKIIEDKENYNITLDEASYFTVLPPIGAITSCFLYSYLNDNLGRKYTLLLIAIPQTTSMLMVAFAKSVWVFYVARFFAGFGDANLFSTLPMYVGEITTPKVRGTWGNVMAFFLYLGLFLINIYGSYFSIRTTALISLIVPALFLATFSFMPESPYFLLMKGRTKDARHSLRKLRQSQDIEEEFEKLKKDVERQMSEKGTWADLFTIRSNLKALLCGIFLRGSQQLAGSASFTVYTQYLFAKSGTELLATTSTAIFMGLLTILNLVASFTLDKFGRKKSYFFSLLFTGLILLVEAIYFLLEQYTEIDMQTINWIPLTGMILWVVSFSFGLGIVPTLMLGELFSTSIKGKGLCALNITFSIFVSTSTKLFHLLSSRIGMFAPFAFFAMSCFLCMILSIYIIPETKGKTLEEIQQDLKGKEKMKSSRAV